MSERKDIKIIAFVGLTGSGKSVAVDYLTDKGYPKVYFGGVFYEAMKEAGFTPGDWPVENKFRKEIREREGNDFVVKRIVNQINSLIDAGQHRIVADGLYSWTEYKVLKHEFPGELTVVAIVSPKHLRHHRLNTRPERPLTNAEADSRDYREIEDIEKGGPIAIADYFIHNDGDLDHLHQQMDDVLEHVQFHQN
ncbi:MAG: putative Dephospho-CoA kinaselike protein [Candidatus Saccharibacteria bacterium]|nr:putative Dephospho-CoA kinaselike protein [Candidatus Saccharibacteria bacterium]